MTTELDVGEIRDYLRKFASDRDWLQYHTPKNLAMAIAGEAGELAAVFQWMTPQESVEAMSDPEQSEHVREEIADVLQYLIRLADVLDVDLSEAVWSKLKKNEGRFPSSGGGM